MTPPCQRFRDRADAGRQLATQLAGRDFRRPVVFAIPCGGVAVGVEVARSLGGELAVLVVRRLTAPYQPRLTLGAVTADGVSYVDAALAQEVGATDSYLRDEKIRRAREARRREEIYGLGAPPPVAGRSAIVVDEGLLTGATAITAVRALRAAGAAEVVIAVPVGPPKVLARLRHQADAVYCLAEAADFIAVERLYGDFHHLRTSEVRQVLAAGVPPAELSAQVP